MEGVSLIVIMAIIVVLAVAAIAVMGWFLERTRRTERLRRRFGSEYDYAVQSAGNKRRAEAELTKREKLAKSLNTHPLTSEESSRFSNAWQEIQTRFVDEPEEANAEVLLEWKIQVAW
jgi:hypothetical protein